MASNAGEIAFGSSLQGHLGPSESRNESERAPFCRKAAQSQSTSLEAMALAFSEHAKCLKPFEIPKRSFGKAFFQGFSFVSHRSLAMDLLELFSPERKRRLLAVEEVPKAAPRGWESFPDPAVSGFLKRKTEAAAEKLRICGSASEMRSFRGLSKESHFKYST